MVALENCKKNELPFFPTKSYLNEDKPKLAECIPEKRITELSKAVVVGLRHGLIKEDLVPYIFPNMATEGRKDYGVDPFNYTVKTGGKNPQYTETFLAAEALGFEPKIQNGMAYIDDRNNYLAKNDPYSEIDVSARAAVLIYHNKSNLKYVNGDPKKTIIRWNGGGTETHLKNVETRMAMLEHPANTKIKAFIEQSLQDARARY